MPRLDEIIEILKKAKHSSPSPVFCPKCQSTKIKLNESFGILPQIYHCDECDYEGYLILELEPE